MRAQGLSASEIKAKLSAAKANDLQYSSGKILSSMCTAPHPAAKRARQMFIESNLGDAKLFPGSAQLEKEVVVSLTELLHGRDSSTGFIVSGGTEANLLALYAARNAAKTKTPEVVVPESAHFSFEKICDLLKVKLVRARVGEEFKVDVTDVEAKVNTDTVAIVGSAGSAELGTVDPIEALAKIAVKRNIPLHVDAAFGGLVLPFLKDLGHPIEPFDFGVAGVQSMTVDPHKMGLAPVPAGGVLFGDVNAIVNVRTETPYLTEPYQYTFIGTRSGASAAAVWAVFESLGREGFRRIVMRCMETTKLLCEELEKAGLELLVHPTLNIVGFRGKNSKRLVDQLRQLGWYVSYVPRLDCLRIVLMPHITKSDIKNFIQALGKSDGQKF